MASSTEYINRDLKYNTIPLSEKGVSGFMTINIDTMITSIVLGLIFLGVFIFFIFVAYRFKVRNPGRL